MKYSLLLLLMLLVFGCSNSALEQELLKTKANLVEVQKELASLELEQQQTEQAALVHIVLFKLKPDADHNQLIAEIKKMAEIPGVYDLEVGPFENLEDKRALSDYSILMQMSFKDEAAYKVYQAHPLHLALKENTLAMMAGPPATYDYLKK